MTHNAPLPDFLQDAIVSLVLAVQDDERGSVHHRATEARVALVAAIRRTVAAAVDVARMEARRTGGEEAHSDSCVGRIHDSLGCSCGVARINAERVAYACRRPAGHDGDHHPNPCGHDGCTGLECLLSTGQSVAVEHPQPTVAFHVPSAPASGGKTCGTCGTVLCCDLPSLAMRCPRCNPAPESEGYCVCGHASMAHYAGGCLIVGGQHGGCGCREFRPSPRSTPEDQ